MEPTPAQEKPVTVYLERISKAFPASRISISNLLHNTTDNGFQALDDITLAIKAGETVGILGSNGAGKSTLLQVMVGTLSPTSGSVHLNGKVSALLELGAGFNPEWTGRRNCEFYSMVQGVAEEQLPALVAEIEAFADVGDFFEKPVRTYSSGMFLRVAFAAAIAIDPDIVIVDEALAVGDSRFQNKCFNKFKQLKEAGKTIILVSHDTVTVSQFCSRAIVMAAGKVVFDGEPEEAVGVYRKHLYGDKVAPQHALEPSVTSIADERQGEVKPASNGTPATPIFEKGAGEGALQTRPHFNPHTTTAGSLPGQLIDVQFLDEHNVPLNGAIPAGKRFAIAVQLAAKTDIRKPQFGLVIKAKDNTLVYGASNFMLKGPEQPVAKGETVVFTYSLTADLASGDYFIDLGIAETDLPEMEVYEWRMSLCSFTVDNFNELYGIADLRGEFNLL